MTHSLLIIGPLSILPRLPRLDIWWRRLRGGLGVAVKACISMLWLAGWDPFNLLSLLQGPPPSAPPPLPAPPASQQHAVSVPGRISALHREERISANHSAHLHARSQRNTWALRAAPPLYKTWQSHHTGSTSSTATAVRGSTQDHSSSSWIIFFFCDSGTLYHTVCLQGRCDNASNIFWYRLALNIKKQSLIL